ncbi:MAG: arginine decarboxylase [Tepidanaerobacteraceae bacterium]|nr:arginine decarboxylase [Tepidanaerobacteraceae bacterium]
MNKKLDMPLVKALIRYARKGSVRFHMPGHKGGGNFLSVFNRRFGRSILKWDVTELPGLDNLHNPGGVIKEAEARLAKLYRADQSFFLVNGSTSGVLAMMGATLNPKDTVILSRASHSSVLSGLILTKAKPVYVMPEWHEGLGVHTQITPEALQRAVNQTPEAKSVLITNPTYQGFCPDLKKICEIARQNRMLVLVDEAHGPHLSFSLHLPPSAGDFGADAWVQSPHKMLFSLTQSAWLHVKGSRIDRERLRSYLSIVTSTSPSYILMASLDYTASIMQSRGKLLVEKALYMAERARKVINRYTAFHCVGDELKGRAGISDIDLTRLMVNVSIAGFTGFEVEKLLRQKYNIYAEYADAYNVYFLVTAANTKQDIRSLVKALMDISKDKYKYNNSICGKKHKDADGMLKVISDVFKRLPIKAMEPHEAFYSKGEWIPLKYAAGRIAKKALIPYPPGVPILMPGEVIEKEHIEIIRKLLEAGCFVHGVDDNRIYAICS